ncbi:Pre-mRNA-splicing factor SLU7 [Fukomys damarensis]|uniref:Pre-mRNA-splicing factor SLU7 n=1 Tax=Fukomys damarensis TaxID=885580 RepID=A0A091DXH8_FUKDA|nr:Pre-mRNA-splicing factor SLU7 [Fukomys damarensis]
MAQTQLSTWEAYEKGSEVHLQADLTKLDLLFFPCALNAEEAHLLQVKDIIQIDERKEPYNSTYETREPTEREMEAYRMKGTAQENGEPVGSEVTEDHISGLHSHCEHPVGQCTET